MFTYSPQKKIIVEFIKMTLCNILNTECLSWTVKLLLFFRKILQVPQILWFSSIFVYLNPFYYSTFKRSLMLQKEKPCIKSRGGTFEQNGDVYISLILPKYHIFSFSTAFSTSFSTEPPPMEHQWAFEPSVIVAYESLGYPQCEKMDLKIIQSLLERVQIHKTHFFPNKLCQIKLVVLSRKHTFQQPSMSKTQLQSGLRWPMRL